MLAGGLQRPRQSGDDDHGVLACSNQRRSIMQPWPSASHKLAKSQHSVGANILVFLEKSQGLSHSVSQPVPMTMPAG